MTGRPRTPNGGDDGDADLPPENGESADVAESPRPGDPGSMRQAQEQTGDCAAMGRPKSGAEVGAVARTGPAAPDFAGAEIDPNKITAYAMNPDHPVGKNKYRVIHSATGLEPADAVRIEQQIRDGVRAGTPILGRPDQYGQRWTIDVPLTGPSGTIVVRTAWIVDVGSTSPRLVTISFPKD